MGADQDVVAVLETPTAQLNGRLGRVNWSALAIFAICLLVTGFWTSKGVHDIAASLRDGQWDHHLWDDDFMQLLITVVPGASAWFVALKFCVYYPSPRVTLNMALAMREAASAGDDELAPTLAMREGDPPQVDPLPHSYGPFKRPQGLLSMMRGLLATLLVLLGCLCLGGVVVIWLFAPHISSRPTVTLILAVVGALLILPAVLFARRTVSLARPIEIASDDLGLTFTGPALQQPIAIPWSEVRAFLTCRYGNSLNPSKAYVVVGRDQSIGWIVDKRTHGVPLVGSEHLVRLIQARAPVPLRDVTQMAEWLTSTRWSKEYRAGYARFHERSRTRGPSPVKLWTPITTKRLMLATLLVVLIPLLPAPAIYVSGHIMQRVQERRAEQQLRQIHTHTPLYFDALTTPSGDWPQHAATDDDPLEYGVTSSGYQIFVPGDYQVGQLPTLAPQGRSFGDVAVEVTVRNTGEVYTGVGLALHLSDGGRDYVAFVVTPNDEQYPGWNVEHYGAPVSLPKAGDSNSDLFSDTGYVSSQQSKAIHTGPDATNTLTAIIRGADYTLFINGVYVGDFHDPYPHPGPIGLEAELSSGTATFTNFTVYPL